MSQNRDPRSQVKAGMGGLVGPWDSICRGAPQFVPPLHFLVCPKTSLWVILCPAETWDWGGAVWVTSSPLTQVGCPPCKSASRGARNNPRMEFPPPAWEREESGRDASGSRGRMLLNPKGDRCWPLTTSLLTVNLPMMLRAFWALFYNIWGNFGATGPLKKFL